jgi:membrane-bound metal-dependent hydrolase YbcI (DUF457 family)
MESTHYKKLSFFVLLLCLFFIWMKGSDFNSNIIRPLFQSLILHPGVRIDSMYSMFISVLSPIVAKGFRCSSNALIMDPVARTTDRALDGL